MMIAVSNQNPDQKKLSTANSKCKDEKRERLCFWYGEEGKERESKEKIKGEIDFFVLFLHAMLIA